MANFWDLPRPIRDTIYRLHLVHDEPITCEKHLQLASGKEPGTEYRPERFVPRICQVSAKLDKEASPIYYGDNHFAFGRIRSDENSNIIAFAWRTKPRHVRMIRKVTYGWPEQIWGSFTITARESFLIIARMTNLRELYIRVDEEEMVRKMLSSRRKQQWGPLPPLTAQDGLAVLKHPGMIGLLKVRGVPHVEFIKHLNSRSEVEGGPIVGGVLQTHVLPKITGPKQPQAAELREAFAFLSLPPELRNRIYGMLLHVDGPVTPSPKVPSSAPKKASSKSNLPSLGSALNLLAANRQIHNEAVGIFYASNRFEFDYPTQLSACMVTLGEVRLRNIRDITVYYHNVNSGGIDIVEITFGMLKQLTGLRRLHILFNGGTHGLHRHVAHSGVWCKYSVPNPSRLPGMKALFTLRGIKDIKIRDLELDEKIEKLKKDKLWPDGFGAKSSSWTYVRLWLVLEHFNTALADAQVGKVNKKLLNDDQWHWLDEFPTIDPEPKVIEPEKSDAAEEALRPKFSEEAEADHDGDAGAEGESSDDENVGTQGEPGHGGDEGEIIEPGDGGESGDDGESYYTDDDDSGDYGNGERGKRYAAREASVEM